MFSHNPEVMGSNSGWLKLGCVCFLLSKSTGRMAWARQSVQTGAYSLYHWILVCQWDSTAWILVQELIQYVSRCGVLQVSLQRGPLDYIYIQ